MSSIAILGGTGQQGRALAQRFQHAGLQVIVGSRDPDRARAAVSAWTVVAPAVEVADNAAAVARADVTFLAVPFTFVEPLLDELRPRFRAGSLVVDLIVPVTFVGGKMAMVEVAEGSAAEHVRARLPASGSRSLAARAPASPSATQPRMAGRAAAGGLGRGE